MLTDNKIFTHLKWLKPERGLYGWTYCRLCGATILMEATGDHHALDLHTAWHEAQDKETK